MPPRNADRAFLVGETIHLTSRVSLPGTKTPTDPTTVSITAMRREGVEVLQAPVPFVRVREGEYRLSLATENLTPGTWDLVVTHASGPERVTLATDTFVLNAP